MKGIRYIRRSIIRDKLNLIKDMLLFLAGLTIVPGLSYLFGWLAKWPAPVLYVVVLIESLLLLTSIISLLFLLNRLSLANKYLKDTNTTWQELEMELETEVAFNKEASK